MEATGNASGTTTRTESIKDRKFGDYLSDTFYDLTFKSAEEYPEKRDNANINTDSTMGTMLKYGSLASVYFTDHYILPKKFAEAESEGWVHWHDKDFGFLTVNCAQIDLPRLFEKGFNTGHGAIRPPQNIMSYASLACVILQANQNECFGGQSLAALDYSLAPGVRKSFKKNFLDYFRADIDLVLDDHGQENIEDFLKLNPECPTYHNKDSEDSFTHQLIEYLVNVKHYGDMNVADDLVRNMVNHSVVHATALTEKQTHQAMEAMIHNLNTLHSRAGAQVPFSSINFGLDITPEGRLVTKMILKATEEGLGNNETPIFPVSIFTLKKGINYDLDDPNYDMFKYACEVSAKRLFPNFSSADASCNLPFYKEDDYRTWPAYMGCRTHVVNNVNGEQVFTGRGNFAFATINLPKIAIEAKGNVKKFYKLFDKYIDICKEYLEFRFDIVAKRHAYNYPFLIGEGIWNGGDKLHPNDTIREVIKQSSLSIGFCGLAECLKSLIGMHHGESDEAQTLGLEIIKHLHERTNQFTQETHLNWSTFATPAESTAGSFAKSNREHYGIIDGVTDREYLTNSFHVPVYCKISAMDKIRLEAPYHKECLAGHISYIEMDGDPTKNLKAFESVIRAMHDADMGYFSINHKVDRDPICGYTGIIQNECPHCHRLDGESPVHHIEMPKIHCC